MATVSSTIKMMDAMSGPIGKVVQRMDNLLASSSKLNDMMSNSPGNSLIPANTVADQSKMITNNQQIIQLTQVINNNYQQINNTLNQTVEQTKQTENQQEKVNESVKQGTSEAGGFLNKVLAIGSAYLGFNKIKSFFSDSIDVANEQIRAEQRLQSIMGNINGMTQDGIELVKKRAKELEKNTAIGASVGMFGQSQLSQYVYDPKNIVAMTDAMYNLATETYGANVSQDQLTQTANLMGKVMMGDINALSRNGFKIDAIFTEAEQKLLKTGTEAERAAMVIEMIDENLAGLAETMAQTPEGQWIRMNNTFDSIKEKIGYGLMPVMSSFVDYIMENAPMIEAIFLNTFGTVIDLLMNIFEVSTSVISFMVDNWALIEPVIWGLTTALTAYLLATKLYAIAQAVATAATNQGSLAFAIKTLATHGLAAAWNSLNTAMKANIFILIITLIIGLITWLVQLWKKNDAFAAGLMRAWNGILNFFDQIPIFFVKVWNGVVNSAQTMKVQTLKIVEDLVNGVIDGINWMIEKLNKIPGISIDTIGNVEFASKAAVEAEAIRQAGEDAVKSMEDKAASKAAEREQKVVDMLNERAAEREREEELKNERFSAPDPIGVAGMATGAWDVGDGTLPNIDKVKKVGKIEDKVDISSEDLKTMRELAEMKNIQNFVTVQPQLSFGDTHIRQESDMDTLIAKLTDSLQEEINVSVSSVTA